MQKSISLPKAITKKLVIPYILPPTQMGKGIINWGLEYVWVCSKCRAPINLVHNKMYWACDCNKLKE
jgi:hypothetical protein